jgi:anthranilate phosphoribosyltransferase
MSVPGTAEPLQSVIRRLTTGEALPPDELTEAFGAIMTGQASPAQIAAVLVGMRARGEIPSDVASVVRALRNTMVVLDVPDPDELVDTCGTGGGTIPTFNISTAAALLAAGAGVRIAKHGNRSFTSKCGSADVFEALGVAIQLTPEQMKRALAEAGMVFMFAPLMHPAMKHVGPVRSELKVQTVMNIVGPLSNPARARRQVVGVADERRVPLIAGALAELESIHAMVVHGAGMDEISPLGETRVHEIRAGKSKEWVIDPARFGFRDLNAEDLGGGSPAENAEHITRVLSGQGSPSATAAVVLNAAAAIYVGGAAPSYEAGVERAHSALRDGAGTETLSRLRAAVSRG